MRQVLSLALPAFCQQMLNFVVGVSDRYLAGHLRPESPGQEVAFLAAQTTASYVAWFLSSYTVVVSVGATALVARCVGAGDRAAAVRVTHQALLLAVMFGMLASAVGLAGLGTLTAFVRLEGESARLAIAFLTPLLVLYPFQMVGSAGVACLAGAGDTRAGLWVLGGTAVLNVPLAWGLCHGVGPLPGLGFAGIALGTGLAHALGGVAIILLLVSGRAGLRLTAGGFTPDAGLVGRILRVSVPAAVDSLSGVACQFWFLGIVNALGPVASAAHGVALQWEALGFLSGSAFATAAMTLVGQNLGAGRPDRAAAGAWSALGLGCGVMTAMGVAFFVLAEPMFRLFCPDPSQSEVVAAGVPALRLVAFAMPPLASSIVLTAALRGAGDARVPVLFTWAGFLLVRIPLAYVLTGESVDLGPLGVWAGAGLGLLGAWVAMAADIYTRGLLLFARFAGGRWRGMWV